MTAKPFDVAAAREAIAALDACESSTFPFACALGDACDEIEKLRRAARALVGDLTARDEEPTHFSSWFVLLEALGIEVE